ncbi:AAA family ATPase [bacterium]|nr:AAA family ATPase [bacterium]
MISEIHMNEVSSFKRPAILETDKKINLVYGLNGVGKSTISNFLYNINDARFTQCRKVPNQTAPILVYNQKFVQDNFFVADSLKGIFSLSKENKDAEEKIARATRRCSDLVQTLKENQSARDNIAQTFEKQEQQAMDEIWKIKSQYSGGDRVLEYCLEGLKGQKGKLFTHLQSTTMPSSEPKRDIQALRKEVDAIKGDTAQFQQKLPELEFSAQEIELHTIFGTAILGNRDSEVSALIEKLGNADWVQQGLGFLSNEIRESGEACPFCQEPTITSNFIESIRGYFDDAYQKQVEQLERFKERYDSEIKSLRDLRSYTEHPFAQGYAEPLTRKYQAVTDALRTNLEKIEIKIENPKMLQILDDSIDLINEFNLEVASINGHIEEYNERLNNRDTSLSALKGEFWEIMRWKYDQTMTRYYSDRESAEKKLKETDEAIKKITADIDEAESEIAMAQKETVNTDEAVDAINFGLVDIGIDGFKISKHSEGLYRVVRSGESEHAFHTLSEGEKMMISFLYFCELCKGKSSIEDTHTQRIAVIDDPISSLSHIFVFNVAQLIRTVFFNNDRFIQVFILTHSLYFFYELTDPNHIRRKKTQKLFRVSKTSAHSSIQVMKYEEIQNDYQAYWSVVNDPTQPPALIANCMRNIIEYFFNFVRKKDLNNVFLMPELRNEKFQSFCRYINRESHSLGQNIIDMKEFNYATFKDGLKLVFEKTGYADHFNEMAKV